MTHQDLVCVQELSDYCCSLQGMREQSCTVGRLAFSEEARSAFDKFLFSGFYIFLDTLEGSKGTRLVHHAATILSLCKKFCKFEFHFWKAACWFLIILIIGCVGKETFQSSKLRVGIDIFFLSQVGSLVVNTGGKHGSNSADCTDCVFFENTLN